MISGLEVPSGMGALMAMTVCARRLRVIGMIRMFI